MCLGGLGIGCGDAMRGLSERNLGVAVFESCCDSVAGGGAIPNQGGDDVNDKCGPTAVGPDAGYHLPERSEGKCDGLMVGYYQKGGDVGFDTDGAVFLECGELAGVDWFMCGVVSKEDGIVGERGWHRCR